jgi:hypothetical protein
VSADVPDTPPLLAAAGQVLRILGAAGHRACLIGGLAVQRWGEPRVTQDVDVSVLAPYGDEAAVIATLTAAFQLRMAGAEQFALDRRVLLLRTPVHVNVDVALAAHPFEAEAIARAVTWTPESDLDLRVCMAEHLVVYKLVAARPQDLVDVSNVVRRQGRRLDIDVVRRWGREFAELKDDPDLLRPFEEALRRTI